MAFWPDSKTGLPQLAVSRAPPTECIELAVEALRWVAFLVTVSGKGKDHMGNTSKGGTGSRHAHPCKGKSPLWPAEGRVGDRLSTDLRAP